MAKLSQKKRAQFAADVADLDAYLTSNGAEKGTDKRWNIDDFFTVWDMPTRFGRLEITVVTDGDDMICARFMDELSDEDKKRVPANDDLNRYSLKWNCLVSKDGKADFHEAVIAFKDRVSKILPQTPSPKPAAGHAALPWSIFVPRFGFAVVVDNNGKQIVKTDCSISSHGWIELPAESEANAAFIVLACNHHAALVEALKAVVNCDGYYYDLDGGSDITKEFEAVLKRVETIIATVKPQ